MLMTDIWGRDRYKGVVVLSVCRHQCTGLKRFDYTAKGGTGDWDLDFSHDEQNEVAEKV